MCFRAVSRRATLVLFVGSYTKSSLVVASFAREARAAVRDPIISTTVVAALPLCWLYCRSRQQQRPLRLLYIVQDIFPLLLPIILANWWPRLKASVSVDSLVISYILWTLEADVAFINFIQ